MKVSAAPVAVRGEPATKSFLGKEILLCETMIGFASIAANERLRTRGAAMMFAQQTEGMKSA
jgi:hypothetical protein